LRSRQGGEKEEDINKNQNLIFFNHVKHVIVLVVSRAFSNPKILEKLILSF